ncbi:MAG: class II D-tagatose-bisphosphate aldolase non-catalytic subunit, partial [Alphaproteobacteria bacterium]
STDYQPVEALTGLVEDGFPILKVGPGLTFALREALYGLDHIADIMQPVNADQTLRGTMERIMLKAPTNWSKYYHGSESELRLQRHFSYSDRIRYYWPHPEAAKAVSVLFARLGERAIPETLVSQYLGPLYPEVATGALEATAQNILMAAVKRVLSIYGDATNPS